MKTKIVLLITFLGLALVPAMPAAEKEKEPDRAKREAGPNGGRVIHSVEPHY